MGRLARSLRFFGLFAVSLAALSACAPPATELIVVIDTDLSVPSELDEVEVSVRGPDGMTYDRAARLTASSDLPLTLTLIPAGESLGPVEVEVSGLLRGTERVNRRARATAVRGESRVLLMFLFENCIGVMCTSTSLSCGEEGCAPVEVTDLPPYTGTLPRLDAGVDARMIDGGPPRDGGDASMPDTGPPPACTDDDGCDDGVPCTTDTCVEDFCQFIPDDAMCDDGEPCTDDVCGATGCGTAPNTASCDDGVFCNGFDTCGGGTCSVHASNPCIGATVCDETGDRCTGCTTDVDCPARSEGSWGSCDYVDGCDQSAMRTRTVRTYACTGGSCVPSDSTETDPCNRSTDGSECGVGSCGGFGGCAYSDGCDEDAVQTRTCTDLRCSSGTCRATNRDETMPCSRDTDGIGCSGTTCGGYGGCDYADGCDESATQYQTCNDFRCGAGSCTAYPRTESMGCSRDTDGASCGAGLACSAGSCIPCSRTLSGGHGSVGSSYFTAVSGSGSSLTFTDGATGPGTITASGVSFAGGVTLPIAIWQVAASGSTITFTDWDGVTSGSISVSGASVSGSGGPPCEFTPYGCFPPYVGRVEGMSGGLRLYYTDGSQTVISFACP